MMTGPRRIVCLTEEPTETLYALGEQDRIVGISGFTVRPPQARKEKPKVFAFSSGDLEKILAVEPDLVLGFSDMQADVARDLIKAWVDAFRAEGLKVGFYYSLVDWHHPDFTIDMYHPLRNRPDVEALNQGRDMARYAQYLRDQVTELLTNYGKIDIICDGGVQRGSHVLKALAAGATACSGGRLYLYALAAAGQPGVERIVGKLRDEIDRDMRLMGVKSVAQLNRSMLRYR